MLINKIKKHVYTIYLNKKISKISPILFYLLLVDYLKWKRLRQMIFTHQVYKII